MNTDTYITTIRNDWLLARKQGNVPKYQALQSALNAIDNASAVTAPANPAVTEVARKELSIDQVQEIIRKEVTELQEALAIYKNVDTEKTAALKVKLATLNGYLQE